MTRINFYEIPQDRDAAWRFCCRLAHKLGLQQRHVLIQVPSREDAAQLSELLWSLEPESFLPHALAETAAGGGVEDEIGGRIESEAKPGSNERVLLNWLDDPGDHHDVLINLMPTTPTWFSRFEVVAELVYHEPRYLKMKREVFQFYRQRGYPLDHHRLPPQ